MPVGMPAAAVESDFSPRKLKIAGACLIGMVLGTSLLLIGPMSMIMLPMIREFG